MEFFRLDRVPAVAWTGLGTSFAVFINALSLKYLLAHPVGTVAAYACSGSLIALAIGGTAATSYQLYQYLKTPRVPPARPHAE